MTQPSLNDKISTNEDYGTVILIPHFKKVRVVGRNMEVREVGMEEIGGILDLPSTSYCCSILSIIIPFVILLFLYMKMFYTMSANIFLYILYRAIKLTLPYSSRSST